MPFSFTNAPTVFQGLANDVLCDVLNHLVFVYIEKILIFSVCSPVLLWLLQHLLFEKAKNYEFHAQRSPPGLRDLAGEFLHGPW